MDALGYRGYACAQGHACVDTRYERGGAGALASVDTPVRYTTVGWVAEWGGSEWPMFFSVTGSPLVGVTHYAVGDLDGDGQVGVTDLVLCLRFFGDRREWVDAVRYGIVSRRLLNGW